MFSAIGKRCMELPMCYWQCTQGGLNFYFRSTVGVNFQHVFTDYSSASWKIWCHIWTTTSPFGCPSRLSNQVVFHMKNEQFTPKLARTILLCWCPWWVFWQGVALYCLTTLATIFYVIISLLIDCNKTFQNILSVDWSDNICPAYTEELCTDFTFASRERAACIMVKVSILQERLPLIHITYLQLTKRQSDCEVCQNKQCRWFSYHDHATQMGLCSYVIKVI